MVARPLTAAILSQSRTLVGRHIVPERVFFAREYLRDPRRPLGEIAFLLGYAELGPFVRAFRRWTGQTPAAFRTRAQGSARTPETACPATTAQHVTQAAPPAVRADTRT